MQKYIPTFLLKIILPTKRRRKSPETEKKQIQTLKFPSKFRCTCLLIFYLFPSVFAKLSLAA